MKLLNITMILGFISSIFLASCEKLDEREVFPHSTPVIESVSIEPGTFTYGDSVTLKVKVSDPTTPLSTLNMKMVVDDKVIASGTYRTKGLNTELNVKFATQFVGGLPDNAKAEIILDLANVEDDHTIGSFTNVVGKRKSFEKLYLVLDNGKVFELLPTKEDKLKFQSPDALGLPNKIKYFIAEKITQDNKIDYNGRVWGANGKDIVIAGTAAKFIESSEPMKKSTEQVVFDVYSFTTKLMGVDLQNINTLSLDLFTSEIKTPDNEVFKEGSFILTKDQEIALTGELADLQVVFNMDYFQRIAKDKVKYLGETGPLTLNYSATHKYLLVQEITPAYPAALLLCGKGLGYPSKVKPEATSDWGFDHIKKFVLFRKVKNNVYQGTVYFNPAIADFKPFENKGWANEKKSDAFSLPAIFINSAEKGENNGNWYPAKDAVAGNYKITIDLGSKQVTAEPVELP